MIEEELWRFKLSSNFPDEPLAEVELYVKN